MDEREIRRAKKEARTILERHPWHESRLTDLLRERDAIASFAGGSVVQAAHNGVGDPTAARVARLMEFDNRPDFVRLTQDVKAIRGILDTLDRYDRAIVEWSVWYQHSTAWVAGHPRKTGVQLSDRQIRNRLSSILDKVAARFGLI